MKFIAILGAAQAATLFGSTDACAESEQHRIKVSKHLASLVEMVEPSPMCFEMCKEVGACPTPAGENVNCNCFACSGFDTAAYAAANDGVMTWPELLDHMDTLALKWRDAIKGWRKTAAKL